MPHTVTLADLKDWIETEWTTFALSSGKGSDKKMERGLNGYYRVWDHGAVSYIGTNPVDAIEKYNAAK